MPANADPWRATARDFYHGLLGGHLQGQTFIRVATFNIANLGASDEYKRSLIALVNIIKQTDADLVAVQEVEPNALGKEQIERLSELLNIAADHYGTKRYDHLVSSVHTGDETTAFLWRDPVSLESQIELMDHQEDPDQDGKPTFQRVPTIALFSAGNYDFYVVNCHLYTKKTGPTSEGRGAEFDALVTWLKGLDSDDEKDAIVLGDFNRFLNGKVWGNMM